MRNLRKRRKLIRQMEQANKIPDKLMPQEIKDMLDVAGFRPVIENTPNSAEIKINSGRSNALRCLAVVAAFVLVVGGFAVLRFSNTQFVKKYPSSASSQSADASGLDGLRGTTYKGLYNYINSNSKNIEDFIVDNSYIFKISTLCLLMTMTMWLCISRRSEITSSPLTPLIYSSLAQAWISPPQPA